MRDDVEAAVERLADFPPEDAEQPEVERADTVSDVLTLVVSSEQDEKALRLSAQRLEATLLELPEVTLVSMMGARPFEISIEVSEETLRRFNLTISEVAAAVRASSVNLSSGELRTASGDLLLRTNNKGDRGEDFANLCCAQIRTAAFCALAILQRSVMVLPMSTSYSNSMDDRVCL